MKTIFSSLMLLATLALFTAADKAKLYGEKFSTKNAISASDLSAIMGDKKELPVVLHGTISEVCQAEGCWMRLKNSDGLDPLFIKFNEHSFVIPKDLAGHKAYVNGIAKKQTLSVEEQRHYAEDAGKSQDELEKITEPKTEIKIIATGVIIE